MFTIKNAVRFVIILIFISFVGVAIYYPKYKREQQYQQEWEQSVAPMREAYKNAMEYDRKLKESIKEEKRILKADTYGGETPEETLRLFVEALKKRDPELASKYYLPWLQKDALADMKDWMENHEDSLKEFLTAVDNGVIKRDELFQAIDIDIYGSKDDKYPYSVEMELNRENNIWKISKF